MHPQLVVELARSAVVVATFSFPQSQMHSQSTSTFGLLFLRGLLVRLPIHLTTTSLPNLSPVRSLKLGGRQLGDLRRHPHDFERP